MLILTTQFLTKSFVHYLKIHNQVQGSHDFQYKNFLNKKYEPNKASEGTVSQESFITKIKILEISPFIEASHSVTGSENGDSSVVSIGSTEG